MRLLVVAAKRLVLINTLTKDKSKSETKNGGV
jgi:hypothetical protein